MSRNDEFDFNPFAAPETDLNAPALQETSGRFVYANLWQRLVAAIVDGILHTIITTVICYPILFVFFMTRNGVDENFLSLLEPIIFTIIRILVELLYFALQESSGTQATLGKKAMGLKVVGLSGERISFGRATGRYFAKTLSQLTLLIGFLVQPFTKKKQALYDLMAGTLVVRD